MPTAVHTKQLKARCIDPRVVRARADRMLEALGLSEAELSVVLCSDAFIWELNRSYRGKDRPTDVLAFPQGPVAASGLQLLGDVIISVETARAQALEQGRSLRSEVTHLLAHGLLHLLGYDHQTEEEDRRMRARADLLQAAAARAPAR